LSRAKKLQLAGRLCVNAAGIASSRYFPLPSPSEIEAMLPRRLIIPVQSFSCPRERGGGWCVYALCKYVERGVIVIGIWFLVQTWYFFFTKSAKDYFEKNGAWD
jgi:hypothetical protein